MNKYLTKEYWKANCNKRFCGFNIIEVVGVLFCCSMADAFYHPFAMTRITGFIAYVVIFIVSIVVYALILHLIYNYILK